MGGGERNRFETHPFGCLPQAPWPGAGDRTCKPGTCPRPGIERSSNQWANQPGQYFLMYSNFKGIFIYNKNNIFYLLKHKKYRHLKILHLSLKKLQLYKDNFTFIHLHQLSLRHAHSNIIEIKLLFEINCSQPRSRLHSKWDFWNNL